MPVRPAASWNSFAWLSAFWPVVASSTSNTSLALPGASRSMTLAILESSSIRFFLLCRRPAVSQITTSQPLALPALIASNTTAAGSEPSPCLTKSTPARSAQICSWSMAAARKVSAAASSTFLPSSCRLWASLPMVVVLPTPLTPMTRIMLGLVERLSASSPASIWAMISLSAPLTAVGSLRPSSFTFLRRFSQMRAEVTAPTSAIIRLSSSSSKKSSSILVKELSSASTFPIIESLVFFKPSAILLKNPIS